MIVAAAIRLANGSVFVGKRHGDVFQSIHIILGDKFIQNAGKPSPIQGFINDRLEFLDREDAYHEAFRCEQCKEQKETSPNLAFPDLKWKPCLFSEDLW